MTTSRFDDMRFGRYRIVSIHEPATHTTTTYLPINTVELLPDGTERKGYSFYCSPAERYGHRLAVGDEIEIHVCQPGDYIHCVVRWQGQDWGTQ